MPDPHSEQHHDIETRLRKLEDSDVVTRAALGAARWLGPFIVAAAAVAVAVLK